MPNLRCLVKTLRKLKARYRMTFGGVRGNVLRYISSLKTDESSEMEFTQDFCHFQFGKCNGRI